MSIQVNSPSFRAQHRPGPVDLFAFAACVGVAHRIHYDQEYSRNEEGHRDTVVPGPMQASYIDQSLRAWLRDQPFRGRIESLRYQHRSPVYVNDSLEVSGEIESVDEENGRITWRVETRVADQERPATVGTAVIGVS